MNLCSPEMDQALTHWLFCQDGLLFLFSISKPARWGQADHKTWAWWGVSRVSSEVTVVGRMGGRGHVFPSLACVITLQSARALSDPSSALEWTPSKGPMISAHNGYLPNGYLPNGYLPNDYLPNGYLPNGYLPNGTSLGCSKDLEALKAGVMAAK